MKACDADSAKLIKYYERIKDEGDLIYNLANILNSSIKLKLYETWDRQILNEDDDAEKASSSFAADYRKNFIDYYCKNYEDSHADSRKDNQETEKSDKIMQKDNAFDNILTIL